MAQFIPLRVPLNWSNPAATLDRHFFCGLVYQFSLGRCRWGASMEPNSLTRSRAPPRAVWPGQREQWLSCLTRTLTLRSNPNPHPHPHPHLTLTRSSSSSRPAPNPNPNPDPDPNPDPNPNPNHRSTARPRAVRPGQPAGQRKQWLSCLTLTLRSNPHPNPSPNPN